MEQKDYYERLNDYFPEEEMKDPRQMRDLLEEKDTYYKEETEDYILMYAEFPTFIFIDYLLVDAQTRGKGIGSKIIQRLKQKGKSILLEVEPPDQHDEDTEKRISFYKKHGFIWADQIKYQRKTDQGEPLDMEIYFWSPTKLPQEEVMAKMAKACEEIHNFRAKRYYDRKPADPKKVLDLQD